MVFEARNVRGPGVKNASFELHRGEVLGFSGMAGSGRSELMEVLFGGRPLEGGEILMNGQRVRHASPKSAIRNRMCFITEDRQNTGLFLEQTIAENVVVANMVNTRAVFASPSAEVQIGNGFVRKLLTSRPEDAHRPGHEPLRRQPAEGGARQVVQHERRDLHLRRADARHRRRTPSRKSTRRWSSS